MHTPRRSRFRFSLRTLLLVVTIASAGFGWLGSKMRQAQRQRVSVAAIRELGCTLTYDYEWKTSSKRSFNRLDGPPPGPAWLRNLVGIDFLAHVNFMDVAGGTFKDADCQLLQEHTKLKWLLLDSTPITDAGLSHLQGLVSLEYLDLSDTEVTDAGLVYLQGLAKLEELYVGGTQITAKGCQELRKALPQLEIVR